MKIESATIQPHYVLEPLDGGKVRVSLYANQEEIITEDGPHYLYDHYVVEAIDRPQLAAYISGNLDAWVAAAADAEREEVAAEARKARNALIAATDYLFESDYPITKKKKTEWEAYRKALRDVTEQPGFPYEIDWPVKPQ